MGEMLFGGVQKKKKMPCNNIITENENTLLTPAYSILANLASCSELSVICFYKSMRCRAISKVDELKKSLDQRLSHINNSYTKFVRENVSR